MTIKAALLWGRNRTHTMAVFSTLWDPLLGNEHGADQGRLGHWQKVNCLHGLTQHVVSLFGPFRNLSLEIVGSSVFALIAI